MISGAALLGVALTLGPDVRAQVTTEKTTTTTTTTSASGTLTSLAPGSIIIRSQTASTPTRYTSTRTTTYVDENGEPIAAETVHSGAPVTVYYDETADGLVASKVVVTRKSTTDELGTPTTTTIEKKETTTVTPP
jgi:hypothetical protein